MKPLWIFKKNSIVAVVLILLAGMATAGVLVWKNEKKQAPPEENTGGISVIEQASNIFNRKVQIYNKTELNLPEQSEDSNFNDAAQFSSQSSSANFTKVIASNMGLGVAQGKINKSDLKNPLAFTDTKTQKAMRDFLEGFNPQISERELKVSYDNSAEAVRKYAEQVSKAIPERPVNKKESQIFIEAMQTSNFAVIDQYIEYFNQSIANMKKVAVPSDFLQIHKREIELFIASKQVYENIKEINNDPLKTVLALQENQRIKEEMMNLMQEFTDLAYKHIY